MSSLPLRPKKVLMFWESPMKNVGKIFGIPISSSAGVHFFQEQPNSLAFYAKSVPTHISNTCFFSF